MKTNNFLNFHQKLKPTAIETTEHLLNKTLLNGVGVLLIGNK
jgi:hypothetical protein